MSFIHRGEGDNVYVIDKGVVLKQAGQAALVPVDADESAQVLSRNLLDGYLRTHPEAADLHPTVLVDQALSWAEGLLEIQKAAAGD